MEYYDGIICLYEVGKENQIKYPYIMSSKTVSTFYKIQEPQWFSVG